MTPQYRLNDIEDMIPYNVLLTTPRLLRCSFCSKFPTRNQKEVIEVIPGPNLSGVQRDVISYNGVMSACEAWSQRFGHFWLSFGNFCNIFFQYIYIYI